MSVVDYILSGIALYFIYRSYNAVKDVPKDLNEMKVVQAQHGVKIDNLSEQLKNKLNN